MSADFQTPGVVRRGRIFVRLLRITVRDYTKLPLCTRLKTFCNTYLSSQVKIEVTDSEDSDKEFEWSRSSLPSIYLGVFLILFMLFKVETCKLKNYGSFLNYVFEVYPEHN